MRKTAVCCSFFFYATVLSTADDFTAGENGIIRINNYDLSLNGENTGQVTGPLPKTMVMDNDMIVLSAGFRLDESRRNKSLGIYIGPTNYPCDIYLNGVLIFKSGTHDEKYIASAFPAGCVLLPPEVCRYSDPVNQLEIKLYPRGYTTPFPELVIADFTDADKMCFRRNFFSTYLIRAVSLLSLVISLYFFMLFFAGGRNQKKYLYFSFLGISFVLAYLEMVFCSNSHAELLFMKISKCGFNFIMFSLTLFTVEIAPPRKFRKLLIALTALPVVVFGVMIILKNNRLDETLSAIESSVQKANEELFGAIQNQTAFAEEQLVESRQILSSVQDLIRDTVLIKNLSSQEKETNEKTAEVLKSFRNALDSFANVLEKQNSHSVQIQDHMNRIQSLFGSLYGSVENLFNIVNRKG